MSDSGGSPASTPRVELEPIPKEVANERKQQGNDCFRAGQWNEAIIAYRSALSCLPKRPQKLAPAPRDADGSDDRQEGDESEGSGSKKDEDGKPGEDEDVIEVMAPGVDELDKDSEFRKLRAVLNANIGACFVKLGDHKEAAEACTEALLDDPTYAKALERRANSNDIINTWSSLTSVQEDYKKLLASDALSDAQKYEIRKKDQKLKPRLEAAQKKETEEMMSKLKGFGNSILGNFGLSTDNFQFVPNGQGGYSMNFNR